MYSSDLRSNQMKSFDNELILPLDDSEKIVNRDQLKQLILRFRDDVEEGYYTFACWSKLHSELFAIPLDPLPQTVLNLWRILKLINFGDDYIPTGLIFDTLVTLMLMAAQTRGQNDKNRPLDEVEGLLKTIFFKFIQFNGKYLSEDQKDELQFFKVIRPVAEGYRKIIIENYQGGNDKNEQNKQFSKLSRNQQLYKMHNVFVYKKNLEKLKKIEEQFKQCTFEPQLSYTSRSMNIEPRYMQPKKDKKNTFASSHVIRDPDYIIQQQEYEEQKLFKANPVPSYPNVNPMGMDEHLERMQKSRQIKKINSLKVHSSGNKAVKQFSIEQRDKQRKLKMLNGFKILFNVKVQVGKRVYRVKVRQNMGITDVVRAIELMVGFKHPDIEEIVKGYFINWEMRVNKKLHPVINQFEYQDDMNY